jgi:peptidoglycan hydrolase-like protein with peptidoglycan-binding domain
MFDLRIRSALAVSATALLLSGPVLAQQQADPPLDQQPDQQVEQQPEQTPEASETSEAPLDLSADDVRAIQEALQQRGYEPGDADGLWGERSQAAMREFQEDEGLPVSGNIDEAAIRALQLWDSIMSAEGAPR